MATTTPPNLVVSTSVADADLLLMWPNATVGPLESITWANFSASMATKLATTWLRPAQNLADVSSAVSARSNLGLGSAATAFTGTSGATLGFLNTANTISATQTYSGASTGLTGFNNLTSGTLAASASPAPYILGVTSGSNTDYIFTCFRDTPFTGTTTMALGVKRSGVLQLPQTAAGTASIDASGNLTTSSDATLKEVVSAFTRGLADLKAMDGPVMYRWLTEIADGVDAQYAGWIAQGVAKGVPEAVHQGRDGLCSLNDRAILAAVFNGVLELLARVEALEAA